jgi:hypothetical protein
MDMASTRKFLFLTLLLGCADVSESELSLGLSHGAIVNGHPATSREQWGTVGMILGDAEDEWLCTGTLIAPDVLVTAAHCVIDPGTGAHVRRIAVVAGAPDIDHAESEEIYEVARIYPHPKAFHGPEKTDPTGLGADYDVALVKTTEHVKQVSVMPILPEANVDDALYLGADLTIAGYGRRMVNELGVSSEDGLHYVGDMHFVRRSAREFLAGSDTDADACPGDSGGPVYTEFDGKTWLVGATSRGRDDYDTWDCGKGGIYTLLSSYESWIRTHAADPGLGDDAFVPERTGETSLHDEGGDDDDDDDLLRSGERVTCSAASGRGSASLAGWMLLTLFCSVALRFGRRMRVARTAQRQRARVSGHQALPFTFYSAPPSREP